MKQLNLRTPLEGVWPFSEFLEEQGALSVSFFEDKTDHNFYHIQATLDQEDHTLEKPLKHISEKISIPCPEFRWEDFDEKEDWVTKVQENFPPLHIGKFFIHGSHVSKQEIENSNAFPIQVNAATAFGTGEHETTQGCLYLLIHLHEKSIAPKEALDMGCGTGILAIAAAKLWPSLPIHCIDIDEQAIKQTEQNAKTNQAFDHMTVQQGDTPTLSPSNLPFDLVVANILANPLKSMAPHMNQAIEKEGKLILSGMLTSQKEGVLATYNACGFTLERSFEKNGWVSLLLVRSPQ